MPLTIHTFACLSDNYAFLLHDEASGGTALVDAPEAPPVRAALKAKGWDLDVILLTHHHYDHIDGAVELAEEYGAEIWGAAADAHRLPPLGKALVEGEDVDLFGEPMQIFDVSGHTVGHIAMYLPESRAAFTADSLMALGCGRLFEGTPDQMWESLSKLAALPADTVIYSGHEYTASNGKFAVTIEPDNADLADRVAQIASTRAAGDFTVPSLLSLELATNPFLRAGLPEVKAAIGMGGASDAEVFAEIRRRKDAF